MEQADKNGMLYQVEGSLSEVISHYYHVFHSGGEPVIKHFAPNLEIIMVFNFGTPIRISFNKATPELIVKQACIVVGPLRKMLNYQLFEGSEAIVVNFKLNGFYRLFKIPLNDLQGETLYDPDKLTDKYCFGAFRDELSSVSELRTKLCMISSYIETLIADHDNAVQPLLRGEHYFNNLAIQPVKAIATDAQLSERTIQIRFQKYAGYSPKELLRFLRFKAVIDRLMNEQHSRTDMFEIILAFGYHDQSHLIKDFQYFLGTTPQYFLKRLKDDEFFVSGQGPKSKDSIR